MFICGPSNLQPSTSSLDHQRQKDREAAGVRVRIGRRAAELVGPDVETWPLRPHCAFEINGDADIRPGVPGRGVGAEVKVALRRGHKARIGGQVGRAGGDPGIVEQIVEIEVVIRGHDRLIARAQADGVPDDDIVPQVGRADDDLDGTAVAAAALGNGIVVDLG